jgi:hypothetical protein
MIPCSPYVALIFSSSGEKEVAKNQCLGPTSCYL